MRRWRSAASWTVLGVMAVLVGCTGAPQVQVTVAPATVSVLPGGTIVFKATVVHACDPSVFWTATCGALAGSGASVTCLAPDVEGPCTVVATSVADPARSGEAAVDVARWAWARQFGTSGYDVADEVAFAADGDVVVVGTTYGAIDGLNAGDGDAFIVRYGPDGSERWRRQVGTSATDEGEGVAAFADGLVVLVGATTGALFAPNVGSTDLWVAKLDADGDPTWFRQYGTPLQDSATGVAVDGDGNVVVGGRTDGTLFGPSAGASDAFVAKYTVEGAEVWDLQFGTDAGEIVQELTVDARYHVFATGYTSGNLDGVNAGLTDLYVIEFDPDGDEVRRAQVGTDAAENGTAIAVLPDGGVVVAGYGTGAFAEEPFGDTDALAIAFAADFSERWRRQFGSDGADYAWGVAVDAAGGAVLVGDTEGDLLRTGLGDGDAFVIQLNP